MVRCRPFTPKEVERNLRNIVYRVDPGTFELREPEDAEKRAANKFETAKFTVDKFFDKNVSNKQLFEDLCKPMVGNLLRGINSSLVTFGLFGTGKSHTIFGSGEEEGVLFCIFDELLDKLQEERFVSSSVALSVLEVANENISDMLVESDTGDNKLELREGYDSWASIASLTEEKVASKREMRMVVKYAPVTKENSRQETARGQGRPQVLEAAHRPLPQGRALRAHRRSDSQGGAFQPHDRRPRELREQDAQDQR